jgi:hypothetical protein
MTSLLLPYAPIISADAGRATLEASILMNEIYGTSAARLCSNLAARDIRRTERDASGAWPRTSQLHPFRPFLCYAGSIVILLLTVLVGTEPDSNG